MVKEREGVVKANERRVGGGAKIGQVACDRERKQKNESKMAPRQKPQEHLPATEGGKYKMI